MPAWLRRTLLLFGCFSSVLAIPGVLAQAETDIVYRHGYAFLDAPKYSDDATHFDYVNPDAPKGGTFRFREMGNWDTFNPVPLRGRVVVGTYFWVKEWRYLWDTLLRDALDETAGYYGLIAEGVAVDPDGAWVAFKLRDAARWHDGQPITVEDVLYTFEVSTTVASPEISVQLVPFSHAEKIGPREVKFHVREAYRGNPVLPIRIGSMPIFPKHYWATRDITKTTVEPPLGSGPYRIGKFSVGRWVEWERVEDYWAKDLLVNKGHWNFDTVRWEYFRDDQVQTEAVKAHVLDGHIESVPRTWFTSYDIPAARAGLLKKIKYRLNKPAGLWWPMFFNMDQPRFQDIRVREAFWLMGDFKWGARRSYNYFGAANSYFEGSELAQVGLPSTRELKLLEPLRDRIPPRVFTQPFGPRPGEGGGYNRENALKAAKLLEAAGWVLKDGELRHSVTDEAFEVRFLAVSAALGRGFISYAKRLERLGIRSSIKAPEISNWLYRIRSGDFDIGAIWFLPEMPPTELLTRQFLSTLADQEYSYNWGNVRDPAVDTLIQAIQEAQNWDDFIAASRALDRVLLWNFYQLPNSSKTEQAYLYWDKYGMPEYDEPLTRHHQIMTWWWDAEKAQRVAEFVGDD